ncbi:TetR/AcrR family transcriptional regulator [Sphingobium sp. CAP-1]|uniref:TetR/AcrR family transcriptional regulator n=1 Tax=Sphingobium sp. CAP-1 TaxID=2676077 RepID=UPI0012BB1F4C|nr:TetR/AcrR family transcriptional regulator [Sphingobium sp. CAP-1]QGP79124.1 TetR family transcriptional regulator [Sphingobium sp. CAP-1]
MTQLLAPSRPGIYARGTETVDAILKAALDVLIDEGADAFTIRRIAARCDMKVGNVSYHFPRKEMLIQVLLDELVDSYGKLLDEMVRKPGLTAEERLKLVIILCLDDIGSKRTTHLFTELWALANHNEFVADRVKAFYERVHGVIGDYVGAINPALSDEDVHTVALFISATMEGATPFLGHGKPWADKMPAFTALAVQSLVTLVRTATSQDISALAPIAAPTREPELA